MAAKSITLRSQANGLPKTSPTPEAEAPGIRSISQLKNELSQMLENTMSDSCDALTLLDIDANDKLTNLSPRPTFSSSSSVAAQSETNEDDTPAEQCDERQYEEEDYEAGQYEAEEFNYVSNEVRGYHSVLLQASDALSEDANTSREHCYYLLASKQIRKLL